MKDMLRGYLNISIRVTVGHIVNDPQQLYESYAAAKQLSSEVTQLHTIQFTKRHGYKHHLISNVQKYILMNLNERISLGETAMHFSLSPGYLSQLFMQVTGTGYVEYVTQARIAASKEMLSSGKYKIYEVADALCFENAFYFSKVFKKIEGISPRDFLKKLFDDESSGQ